jgi:hypothetical protein
MPGGAHLMAGRRRARCIVPLQEGGKRKNMEKRTDLKVGHYTGREESRVGDTVFRQDCLCHQSRETTGGR